MILGLVDYDKIPRFFFVCAVNRLTVKTLVGKVMARRKLPV
ncbi:hypothetical protein APS_2448 [Acetobacter pasteurianus subsp. pasteurianus LMG 1262 = NBRC 106471]|nr:hypothetical protein APS_2448 [Acetobacter pasteurianus subsp. pasteurianus LMG 1262 = NBRC 106471]